MSDRTPKAPQKGASLRLALEIEDPRWTRALPDVAALVEKAIALALADVDDTSRTIEVGQRSVRPAPIAVHSSPALTFRIRPVESRFLAMMTHD